MSKDSANPSLDDKLGAVAREERQRALRALLQHPLLTSDGDHAAEFALVRRHADELRQRLALHTNWPLQVTGDFARLRKTPPELGDASRGAVDRRTGLAFTKARYALLCLALAALERSERQVTLGKLAKDMAELVAADAKLAALGFHFDLKFTEQRRNLVQVIRFLLEQRVLRRVQGDEELFLKDAKSDVLYNIQRSVLSAMLAVRRGPSMIDATSLEGKLAAIVEEPMPETDEGKNRRIRVLMMRHLLDDPVLYYQDLDERERAYLDSQRPFLLRNVEELTGMTAEVRREGIAVLDQRGDMTDLGLPEEGTEGHLALLIAEHLAEKLRANPYVIVGFAALCELTAALIQQHRKHWRKDVENPGADRELTAMTLERLAALRLVRRVEGGGIQPLPAVARYALKLDDAEANESASTNVL
jgi:uncharacterized protein (TIGR02678 family)